MAFNQGELSRIIVHLTEFMSDLDPTVPEEYAILAEISETLTSMVDLYQLLWPPTVDLQPPSITIHRPRSGNT